MPNLLIPALTAVSFEFRGMNGKWDFSPFVLDLSEHPTSDWLNEDQREFNVFFRALMAAPHVVDASMTISWNDGFRVTIPMPKTQEIAMMRSIGDLIAQIGKVMMEHPTFSSMQPDENAMLKLVDRTNRLPAQAVPA